MSAGWPAQFTTSAFNRQGQYAAVLVTVPTVTQNSPFLPWCWPKDHHQYSFRLLTEGWPG